jgi:hypothetical protein
MLFLEVIAHYLLVLLLIDYLFIGLARKGGLNALVLSLGLGWR